MYNKFDACICDFSHERDPGDYWYDCAILESTDILKKFNENDWKQLLKQLEFKPLFWKKRLIECLGDLHSPYELEIILDIINIDDKDLFITCADSLRLLNLSDLNMQKKKEILHNAMYLLNEPNPTMKRILEEFVEKINKTEISGKQKDRV